MEADRIGWNFGTCGGRTPLGIVYIFYEEVGMD